MYLLVALGNPDTSYAKTRHNAGWIMADEIAGTAEWSFDKYAHADKVRLALGGEEVLMIKPRTYMNRSGDAVAKVAKDLSLSSENIIVLHDEVNLPLGEYKVSRGRGTGGHNGVASIEVSLRTRDFYRIRIGVAPTTLIARFQRKTRSLSDYVLGAFRENELRVIRALAEPITKEIVTIR